ncbi:Scr1 family TA system antitoxin-like transcriptional regulator [Streptomyces sp. NRRL WC-3742]|uniref:Scr1 family TA system antitoxin-like transcriptional regulator n=1 Tax=Streptomyces sp. NRRL WC-3742 TaxID=1463934 RepID=UPI0006892D6D|nr:Scr1 family TA system antitoxin-like transcriptional regulator [Streptomyces sp. NRRL WC-3742]
MKKSTVLFSFTIYEAALHTLIGGKEVMRGQLLRLLELEHSRNIRTQVIPIGHAIPSALSGSLVIMETINNEQYAYVETHGTNALHSDPCLVGELSRRHAMIRAQALNVQGSVRLIRKTMEQL